MSPNQPRTYRFATAAQWNRCIVHRIDIGADGQLHPVARLGAHARPVHGSAPATVIAIDRYGAPLWRTDSAEGAVPRVQRPDALGTLQTLEITGIAARSPRWVADRRGVWGFCPGATLVARNERETLDEALTLDVAGSCAAEGEPVTLTTILDIASDARDGAWLLADAPDRAQWLLHVDCEGEPIRCHRVPCGIGRALHLGTVDRGARIVLLEERGQRLAFVDTVSGALLRVVRPAQSSCWTAVRLATDCGNRIVLWGGDFARDGRSPGLLVLDGTGDVVDGPLENLFGPSDSPKVNHVAVHRDSVWFATAAGVWRLDATDHSGAREAESELLTPPLVSLPSDAGRGWLRAEIDVDLPAGAVIEAWFAGTDDARVADEVQRIAADTSISSARRQQSIWNLLEPGPRRRFKGPTMPGVPVAVPLFESQQRWLWLGLRIVTPPGVDPPNVTALRVLYPDLSLARQLPAIFKGAVNDPDGFLRRFVGVLEATTQRFDERIRVLGSNVDPRTAPAIWLDFLARWLDLPWDDALPEAAKRALLSHAGELVARRGTREGLRLLLTDLVDDRNGGVTIIDLTVDHVPIVLGGRGCKGGALPQLLAGASPRAATLGGKAVLGTARLMCSPDDCDPLKVIVPTVRIELFAEPARKKVLEPILGQIVGRYLPAGVRVSVQWPGERGDRDVLGAEGFFVDAEGPGALGSDSVLGRTTLAGRATGRIGTAGIGMGVRLQ